MSRPVFFSIVALFLNTQQLSAAEVVRDQYWPYNSDGVWQMSSELAGQVIEARVEGRLVGIDLNVGSYGTISDLNWQIIPATPNSPDNSSAVLAQGVIQRANLVPQLGLIHIDLANFNLNFKPHDWFALTLHSQTAWRSWYSYRGSDAPNATFTKFGGFWHKQDNSYYSPPYSPAFSTFFELVPEPSISSLLAGCVIVVGACFRVRRDRRA